MLQILVRGSNSTLCIYGADVFGCLWLLFAAYLDGIPVGDDGWQIADADGLFDIDTDGITFDHSDVR
jgi:hypothetical protein